ncbi:MAG: hypothetical protein NVS3B5_09840 [Sphingomicrobium sp.]
MSKVLLSLASSAALVAVAAPASAHPYDYRHDDEHDQLQEQHEDAHDRLDAIHAEAHEEGLDPWEHHQLHRWLRQQHHYEHERLRAEHRWWHGREDWRNRYGRGYYGDYGYYGPSASIQFGIGW